jgi:CheY-like chemotaxis protein
MGLTSPDVKFVTLVTSTRVDQRLWARLLHTHEPMAMDKGAILVVDDDPFIRDVLAELLEEEGYAVATADDGAEALRLVATSRPSLILLDMDMPVVDGREFARRYRQQPGPHAPIAVITAAYDARIAAADIGAQGHLAKPFQVTALLQLITRLGARRASELVPSPSGRGTG